ncbi:LPXTG cell wall anchor domain-containing protein [Acetobacterium sp.]|uniref:LPXTG cell wall anchor domain-containing protein n=1 Tax=Acetobacterium sp. TaxID=1872094 RepID=UPI003593F3A8
MKRISKFLSLLMVASMLSMLIPVSALAAGEAVNEQAAASELGLVLVTTETADTETALTAETANSNEIAPLPAVAEITASADNNLETNVDSEQLVISTIEPETFETAAATYLCLTQNGVIIDVLATNTGSDYAFDAVTNELTLNNFMGEKLNVKSTTVPFKLVLLGTNIIKTDNGFAVKVEGDMNASGTGALIAEGHATPDIMGGGINVVGNLVIDSGTYDVAAVGYESSSSAVGILAGDNAEVMTMGNLTINDGNIDVTAYNSDYAGAFGLFAFGDLVVNGGNIKAFTDSPTSYSRGIGAYDKLVFNGGYTVVESIADHGDAGALFSYNKIIINNGILDLCTSGAVAKALVAEGGIDISGIYGDVDRDAACLYLEPLSAQTFKKQHASSANPKTGVDTSASEAAVAGAALIMLIGLAVAVGKREAQA